MRATLWAVEERWVAIWGFAWRPVKRPDVGTYVKGERLLGTA